MPTRKQTKEAGERIGGSLGIVEVDVLGNGFSLGNHLRVRFTIDISKPLCRGRMVRMGPNQSLWVEFCYERIPIFYYWCGLVDHDERDCMRWVSSKDTPRSEERQFGPWLRAELDRLQRPQIVRVPKEHESEG